MRKLGAILNIAIAIFFVVATCQMVLAKEGKSSASSEKGVAKDKIPPRIQLQTQTKSKSMVNIVPITIKKTTDKASP